MTNVVKPYTVGVILLLCLCVPIAGESQTPLPLEPAQASVIADRTPLFVFSDCMDCRLEVDDTNDFADPESIVEGISGDSLELQSPIQEGNYFWRIREGLGPWSEVREFQLFDIASLSSLNQWLIADSISAGLGELVGTWLDLSSQGHDMVQADPAGQPEIVDSELNGKRALHFDGADLLNGGDVMDLLDGSLNLYVVHRSSELTYALLGKGRGVNDAGAYSLFPASGNYRFLTRDASLATAVGPIGNTLGQYSIVSCRLDRPASQIRVDVNDSEGNPISLVNYSDFIDTDFDFILGAYTETYQFPFTGDVAEVLVFDTILTSEQDSLLERYLRFRYTPPIELGPDRELDDLCSLELDAGGAQYVSYEWSDGSTADTLIVQSPGMYYVTVTDIFGSISSDTLEVSIPGLFLSGDTVLCSGSEILWETGLPVEDFTFTWQDGSTESSFLITEPGSYHVQVDRVDGCTYQSDTLIVILDEYPITTSLGGDVDLCAGNTISLDTGQEEAEEYLWNDAPGTDELVVNESGTYWVEVVNGNGCVAQDTIQVNVLGLAPLADFFFENLCFGETVEFTDTSIPLGGSEIIEWNWDFGDGESTTGANVSHIYNTTDTFQVNLNVLTNVGCADDQTYEVVISPLPVPGFSNGLACSGQPIVFTDESIVASGEIAQASWRFDGVAFGNGSTATFIYPVVGSFETRLVVTTSAGCQDSTFQEIFVNGSPVSDFISDNVCIGEPTPFTADPDGSLSGPIEQFFWDFGSSTSIFEVTSHTFPTPGPQEVSLTVTSAFGCSHDTVKTVIVSNDPQAGFVIGQSCEDSPVQFTDTTIAFEGDPIAQWAWFFDSFGESAESSPSFSFNEADAYTVTLDVTSEAGCSDQVQQEVQVNPLPTSFFSLSPLLGEAPFTPEITNESSGASDYLWTFDLGVTSIEMDPVHTFLDSGLVEVSLLVTNEFGCTDLYTDLILLAPPQTDLILETVDCIIDGDFLRPVLGIRNLSNHRVTEMDIRAEIVEGSVLLEDWQGLLEPDGVLLLPMNSSLFYDAQELPFLCVEILPQEPYLEDKAADNSLCKTIGSEEQEVFWLPPSPNPAIDFVTIRVVNAKKEPLRIECFDLVGRKLIDEERIVGEGLVEDLELDISRLQAGRYLLRLTQGLTDEVFKLQILR